MPIVSMLQTLIITVLVLTMETPVCLSAVDMDSKLTAPMSLLSSSKESVQRSDWTTQATREIPSSSDWITKVTRLRNSPITTTEQAETMPTTTVPATYGTIFDSSTVSDKIDQYFHNENSPKSTSNDSSNKASGLKPESRNESKTALGSWPSPHNYFTDIVHPCKCSDNRSQEIVIDYCDVQNIYLCNSSSKAVVSSVAVYPNTTKIGTLVSVCDQSGLVLELYLNSTNIHTINRDAFKFACSLQVLDLSNNYLLTVDKAWVTHLPNLRMLNISKNRITRNSDGFISLLSNAEVLDFSSNQLRLFSKVNVKEINELATLKHLYLHENPWKCGCVNEDFIQWVQSVSLSMSESTHNGWLDMSQDLEFTDSQRPSLLLPTNQMDTPRPLICIDHRHGNIIQVPILTFNLSPLDCDGREFHRKIITFVLCLSSLVVISLLIVCFYHRKLGAAILYYQFGCVITKKPICADLKSSSKSFKTFRRQLRFRRPFDVILIYDFCDRKIEWWVQKTLLPKLLDKKWNFSIANGPFSGGSLYGEITTGENTESFTPCESNKTSPEGVYVVGDFADQPSDFSMQHFESSKHQSDFKQCQNDQGQGRLKDEMTVHNVKRSLCSLVVASPSFGFNRRCVACLTKATQQRRGGGHDIVVVTWGDLTRETLDCGIRPFLSKRQNLPITARLFWKKLFFLLPTPCRATTFRGRCKNVFRRLRKRSGFPGNETKKPVHSNTIDLCI